MVRDGTRRYPSERLTILLMRGRTTARPEKGRRDQCIRDVTCEGLDCTVTAWTQLGILWTALSTRDQVWKSTGARHCTPPALNSRRLVVEIFKKCGIGCGWQCGKVRADANFNIGP